MKERFEGENGKRRLVEALSTQKVATGEAQIALALANEVELVELNPLDILIQEDADDTDVYFILLGSLSVLVKGRLVATRTTNDHVGEMSAINPSLPRAATVIADTLCVIAKISEPKLAVIASSHSDIWRNFAKELAKRLHQRNSLIMKPNERPRIFIISSKEALSIAHEIQSILSHDFITQAWPDGIFFASSYALEVLEDEVDKSDFAIAIAQPDDLAHVRGQDHNIPRDNVIFELGLFMGRLGRRRTFLFQPVGRELKLPSDLHGLTAINYTIGKSSEITSWLAPSCHEVRKIVQELGIK